MPDGAHGAHRLSDRPWSGRKRGLEGPCGSHDIIKERHDEITAHVRGHQKHQYP